MAELDLGALGDYLRTNGVSIVGDLRASEIAGGRSNLTYRVEDDAQAWVLRRPPAAGLSPSAHDVGREYRIVDALQGTDVPVARTLVNCTDPAVLGVPFAMVGFVDGRVLRTEQDLEGCSDSEVQAIHTELLRVLVRLHDQPYAALNLDGFGRPDGVVERQVRRWRQQWDHVATRELDDVDRLYRALGDVLPRQQRATIVHGDFRIDNTLLDRARPVVLALVDWEMSTIGDPLTDVATMCAYQHRDFDYVVGERGASTSPHWPDVDSLAQDYAALSGADLSEFSTYLALAYFKLAVIAEGIASRRLAGAADGPGFDTAHLAVPGLVAAGLAVLAVRA
jgi:aminoglycoside phosphotransferase (APT) family kinase protein